MTENKLTQLNETETKNHKLTQINESEAQNYNLLGRAWGVDFNHCFYLGHKFKPDFSDRVCAYRVITDDPMVKVITQATGKTYLAIEFYERKEA